LNQLRLGLCILFQFGQTIFEIFDALIAVTICLPELSADLNPGFIDPFFDRTELALNLLQVRSGIRQSRPHIIDIGVYIRDVAALPSLLALEQVNLLRINTGRQPSRTDQH
jgi:hypothetical protein